MSGLSYSQDTAQRGPIRLESPSRSGRTPRNNVGTDQGAEDSRTKRDAELYGVLDNC
ncbi:hypothetical protein PILCRDRAFT_829408 [Piloderma croceum F 1598]|uniref:Uncharacterized protein n=1 Tax=Piloderma croceum (strain F 1598) TaxID=765440 RepID=A0A0C3B6X9_PILCF|nr:hypothetical protein PILCRDRAFT_829408 [Piloderma croceum F 1598]